MQFLANENFPRVSVIRLRSVGYDVAYITEDTPGVEDSEVLARAVLERRIILTFDRDYSELIYRKRMPSPMGVVYFRYIPATPEEPAQDLLLLLNTEGISLEGSFIVLERTQLRRAPIALIIFCDRPLGTALRAIASGNVMLSSVGWALPIRSFPLYSGFSGSAHLIPFLCDSLRGVAIAAIYLPPANAVPPYQGGTTGGY